MTDRAELGGEKFGVPAQAMISAIWSVLERKPWNQINSEAVAYYIEKMPMEWLPQLADFRMTDEQLAQLDPHHVQDAVFLLTRDMFRHNASSLRPENATGWDETWVESLFGEIAKEANLDVARYADWDNPFSLDDPFDHDKIAWAIRIAEPFSAEPEKLAIVHETIVEGVIEDVLKPSDDDWDDDE